MATPDASFHERDAELAVDLGLLRNEMDEIDDSLLEYLNKRAALSARFGALKRRERTMAVHQPEREEATVERLKTLNSQFESRLPAEHIDKIWRLLFALSREIQEKHKI